MPMLLMMLAAASAPMASVRVAFDRAGVPPVDSRG